jgi:hypothetical protein
VDEDAESSDGGEYVPTEYGADSDFDTDYEDGFMDSDGIDLDTMDVDAPHHAAGGGRDGEAIEVEGRDPAPFPHHRGGYHESRELEAQSVCGSEAAWWDGSVDGEQEEWGLTDGDSMGTSEGELSFGDRLSGTLLHSRLVGCCLTSLSLSRDSNKRSG